MEALASKPPAAKVVKSKGNARAAQKSAWRSIPGAVLRWMTVGAAMATLPLLILVRLSAWFYSDFGLWPWIAVAGGVLSATLVFVIVTLLLIKRASGRIHAPRYFKRAILGLAVVYTGYSALFVSAGNVKNEQVKATYTSLHPSLRMTLSTWMLADSRLVITDVERRAEDYDQMGVPRNEASLHFITPSGYVHAVDLRTIDRPEWRNFVATLYFKVMGFRALRHSGSADHLHVSIPVRE